MASTISIWKTVPEIKITEPTPLLDSGEYIPQNNFIVVSKKQQSKFKYGTVF
jgi:hypothetical protein